jgi:hypothetical protein
MFHLPPLASLAARRNLQIMELTHVGDDLRLLARLQ